MYIILAPSGSGKSTLASNSYVLDGDKVLRDTWPKVPRFWEVLPKDELAKLQAKQRAILISTARTRPLIFVTDGGSDLLIEEAAREGIPVVVVSPPRFVLALGGRDREIENAKYDVVALQPEGSDVLGSKSDGKATKPIRKKPSRSETLKRGPDISGAPVFSDFASAAWYLTGQSGSPFDPVKSPAVDSASALSWVQEELSEATETDSLSSQSDAIVDLLGVVLWWVVAAVDSGQWDSVYGAYLQSQIDRNRPLDTPHQVLLNRVSDTAASMYLSPGSWRLVEGLVPKKLDGMDACSYERDVLIPNLGDAYEQALIKWADCDIDDQELDSILRIEGFAKAARKWRSRTSSLAAFILGQHKGGRK